MKMKKVLLMVIFLLFVQSIFSAIGYEHFTVQENQVFTEILVRLSKEFKSIENNSKWTTEEILLNIDNSAIGTIIETMITGYNIDIVLMDKNGTIIYDSDSGEIGRNILTDPLYQNFTEFVERFEQSIAVEKRGEGSYAFLASGMGASQEKHVMWNTINAFGTEIKVCMITK